MLLCITVALVGLFAAAVADAHTTTTTTGVAAPSGGACFFALPNATGLVNLTSVGAVHVGKHFEFGKVEVSFAGFGSALGRVVLPEADAPKLLEAVQAAADKCRGSVGGID